MKLGCSGLPIPQLVEVTCPFRSWLKLPAHSQARNVTNACVWVVTGHLAVVICKDYVTLWPIEMFPWWLLL